MPRSHEVAIFVDNNNNRQTDQSLYCFAHAHGIIGNNQWAMRSLNAWIENRNKVAPDDPVPAHLLSRGDASVLCKWLRCFIQQMKKENGLPHPAVAISYHSANPSFQQGPFEYF